MRNIGYILTDWIFFFSEDNHDDIQKITTSSKNQDFFDEFVTWKLIIAFLPLIPFIIVVVINVLTNPLDLNSFYAFFNNGSLPIISFGIISSGMPYLLEQLKEFPQYHTIRRRVMAISLIFLFLSAALYILQTLSVVNSVINCVTSFASMILAICVYFFSNSVGYKMFMLQSKHIESFEDGISGQVETLQNSLDDLD